MTHFCRVISHGAFAAAVMLGAAVVEAAPIQPDALTELGFWLRADSGVYNSVTTSGGGPSITGGTLATPGQSVAGWEDSAPGSADVTQSNPANQPTYQVVGGNSFVRFDGQDDFLNRVTSGVVARNDPSWTIFVVFNLADIPAGGQQNLFSQYNDGASQVNHYFYVANATSDMHVDELPPSGSSLSPIPVTAGTLSIGSFVQDGANATLSLTTALGAASTSTNTAEVGSINDVDGLRIGGRYANGSTVDLLNGDLGEIIVYNRALTPEEMAGVTEYLAGKFMVPEPGSAGVLAIGAIGLGIAGMRRRKK